MNLSGWMGQLLQRKPCGRHYALSLQDLEKDLQVERAQVGAYQLQAQVAACHPGISKETEESAKRQMRQHAEKLEYLSLQRDLLLQGEQSDYAH